MSFRLLIVEDSPELLEAAGDFFREEGSGLWDVVTASDGNDALAKVNSDNFDLMILDIMLPGASGFDICKAARKTSDCPIIFVTALGSENNILKGYETGCDDYVVKPFSLRHLYAKSLALLKRAKKSGVKYVAEPGGSIRDDLVIERCNEYGMVMAFTGMRLFHH